VAPVTATKHPPSEHTDRAADDHSAGQFATTAGPTQESVGAAESEALRLTVAHPANGVCVIRVGGELDMCTVPLLEACLRKQLTTNPKHLIVDLESVSFLSSSGLHCLLRAREHALASATQLSLAGLVTRAVVRILQISHTLHLFSSYPTVAHALTTIID
jgi:anti-anti-sigma factor